MGKKIKTITKIFWTLFIILLFMLLALNYYSSALFPKQEKENPRFVKVDYIALQNEANSIVPPQITENAKNVFVLTYHRITKNPPVQDYELSYEQFKNNMFALKKAGYQTITTQDLYLFMNNEKQLPDKSFLLTFDDGARQAYYNGDPILKALNYTAVMFVIVSHVMDENASVYYLNKTELENMKNTGRWEIESHTYKSHFRLPISQNTAFIAPALTNKLWIANESRLETDEEYYSRVSIDLEASKRLLEESFNIHINSFALPYGDFGERNSNHPNATNVLYDLTTQYYDLIFYEFPLRDRLYRGNYNDLQQDGYLISRLAADSLQDPDRLIQRIESLREVTLPYYEDYSNPDRWIRTTGEASFVNNSIILSNGRIGNKEGFITYLDGTYLLRNYMYSIQLKNSASSRITLISRFISPQNYVSCVYDNNTIFISKQEKDSPANIIKKVSITETALNQTFLSMSVKGSDVSCFIDGQEKITSNVPGIPLYGGVGIRAENFQTEDKTFAFGGVSISEI